jgi:hypothetical protein
LELALPGLLGNVFALCGFADVSPASTGLAGFHELHGRAFRYMGGSGPKHQQTVTPLLAGQRK